MATYGLSDAFLGDMGFEAAIEKVAAAGFRQIELAARTDTPFSTWMADAAAARKRLSDFGITARSVHVCSAAWHLADPDDEGRQAKVDVVTACFAPAVAVGAAAALIPNGMKVHALAEDKEAEIRRLVAADSGLDDAERQQIQSQGCQATKTANTSQLHDICGKGANRAALQNVLIGVGAGAAVISVFFAYKAFVGRAEHNLSEADHAGPDRDDPGARWQLIPTFSVNPHGADLGFQLRY